MHKLLGIGRRQLYDLVWSKPRTQLAKELGVSDVMIGKMCRQLNVPAPMPGYWASLAAGGKGKRRYVKPALTYSVAERIEEDLDAIVDLLPKVDPNDLDTPIPPKPAFKESIEQTLRRYEALIDRVALPKAARGVHPAVQKLMVEDERRAQLVLTYSWERKPEFVSPEGRRLLSGLSLLLWWWTDLGFKPSSSGTRHIQLRVACGQYSKGFEVGLTTPNGRLLLKGKTAIDGPFQLRFESDNHNSRPDKGIYTFTSFDMPLFKAVTLTLLAEKERRFREWIDWRYDDLTRRRVDAARKAKEAEERKRQEIAAAAAALKKQREDLLNSAMSGRDQADRLRTLVSEVEASLTAEGHADERFITWKVWALGEADALDLRKRTGQELLQWLDGFQLH
ncbi:hypothetical protein ACQUJS_22290 [Ralstonia pseudosolanacearum]|uniref:Hypothethical protein n=1 Tax=Ralstonia solanacearum TaxID=305 RepID=A0A0S4TSP6_RALSL|nr:hypothetical protein RSP799_23485 [Ralstonia solanacearum]CUV13083.1 Hypothethical protein [Ralstonia solanacearum]